MVQLILIAYILLVILLSLAPEAGRAAEPYRDKIAHMAAYFVMGVLGYVSVNTISRKIYLFVFIIMLGGVLELVQSLVPGRSVSLIDAAANMAGAVLSFLICRFCALYVGWGTFESGSNESAGGERK